LRCIAVFVSDVNPGDVLSLASNPLLPEERKERASSEVIERYGLRQALPEPIRQVLDQKGTDNASKSWDWERNRLSKILLLDNQDVVKAAAEIARRYEYEVEIDIANPEGDYRAVADNLISRLLELRPRYKGRKVCLISGGEVSCAVKGDGLGGRNQEFVLYSASRLAAIDSDSTITVLSCGTDGIDGNSNAAGAVAGADIVRAAINQGIDLTDYFINSDSHSFFRQFGGVVFTGPTGNNVRDIRILLSDAVSHLT
jgi:glycerate-2-kinase